MRTLTLAVFAFSFIVLGAVGHNLLFPPAPATVYSMPEHLDVNGTNWNIEQVSVVGAASQNLEGYTECATRHIVILRSSEDKHTALMHELSHAMVCTDAGGGFGVNNLYYNSTTSADHEGIYRFTALWAELLHRNPDLAFYLGQK